MAALAALAWLRCGSGVCGPGLVQVSMFLEALTQLQRILEQKLVWGLNACVWKPVMQQHLLFTIIWTAWSPPKVQSHSCYLPNDSEFEEFYSRVHWFHSATAFKLCSGFIVAGPSLALSQLYHGWCLVLGHNMAHLCEAVLGMAAQLSCSVFFMFAIPVFSCKVGSN